MTITLPTLLVQNFQTVRVLPLGSYDAETYVIPVQPNGNSLLSSLLVLSVDPGATVTVNYFQTTAGNEFEERTNIVSHDVVSVGSIQALQILVTRIHNKVFAEVVVSGGSAVLGITASVVTSFATDLETALKRDGQVSNLQLDRGIPLVIRDTTTGKWELWEGQDGIPAVRLIGDVQVNLAAVTTPTIVNATLPDNLTEVAVPVPTGARRYVVKSRSGAPMAISFTATGTTTDYLTTGAYEVENLDASAILTIYARSQRGSGDVLELLAWS